MRVELEKTNEYGHKYAEIGQDSYGTWWAIPFFENGRPDYHRLCEWDNDSKKIIVKMSWYYRG
jgi:hypothetical protein